MPGDSHATQISLCHAGGAGQGTSLLPVSTFMKKLSRFHKDLKKGGDSACCCNVQYNETLRCGVMDGWDFQSYVIIKEKKRWSGKVKRNILF